MKKYLSILTFLLLMIPVMFASQTFVLAEVFSRTTCGYCPSARSALNQMSQNETQFPYLIPIIWQSDGNHPSPGYNNRHNLYGFTGIPYARFCGNVAQSGGGTNVYNAYVNAYNQTVNRNAPMEIEVRMNINAQNELVVTADVVMSGNITTNSNNIVFVLTYDLTGIMNPDYFASAKSYYAQSFPLTTAGQEQTFIRNHTIDDAWDMEKLTAIVFVQSFDNTNAIVHQAAKRSFDALSSAFTSNVQQGPPSLHVQFQSLSMPAHTITNYYWDLTGDGNIDSFLENPSFIYDEPGTYDVSLTISDGVEESVLVMEDYITVLEPDNVSGNISGIFSKDFAPYKIVGDVTVPEDGFLEIEPGLQIEIEDAAITIKGHLTANAFDAEPIVFTSNSSWKGLRVENSDFENKVVNCVLNNATETALRVSNSRIEITGNTFHNNSAISTNAGALRIISSDNTTLRNNIFSNNQSAQGAGVLEMEASSFNVTNNLFVNNTGQIASTLFIKLGSSTDIMNNTIAYNTYNAANGFHVLNSASYVNIKNTIVIGEGTIFSSIVGAMTLAEYSNISGGFEGVAVIDEDPMFEEPSEGYGVQFDGLNAVWYLQDESPCIDAGNTSTSNNDPEDPDNPGFALFPAKGELRNDMGAYGGSLTNYWLSVDDDYLLSVPGTDHVISAYPNPFNPSVTISLANVDYNDSNPITLKIFNTKGQLVKTFAENDITDRKSFIWNGIDDAQEPVSSGVYLIQFTTQGIDSGQKIILLK